MEDDHVDAKSLFFNAAGEQKLTPREMWHLRICEECQDLRKLFRHLDSFQVKKSAASVPPKKSANF